MIILWVIIAFLVLSSIILIHEYGHYISARVFWMHVEEFWLGIPPRAKKLWKNSEETLFTLNWIPLGGFVRIYGQDMPLKSGEKETKKSFSSKNIFQKTLVLLAGSCMNFLLWCLLLWLIFSFGGKPIGINTLIDIDSESLLLPSLEYAEEIGFVIREPGILLFPLPQSLAEVSGILPGDILLTIDTMSFQSPEEIVNYISSRPDQEVTLLLERSLENEQTKTLTLSLTTSPEWKIWSVLAPRISIDEDFHYDFTFSESFLAAIHESYVHIKLSLSGLTLLWKNIFHPETPEQRQEAVQQVSGPIGIFALISRSVELWILYILSIMAVLSVSIWVLNLIPLPALDGWRIILLYIRSGVSAIFGKAALGYMVENFLHFLFFVLIIALSIFIAYNDIIKLFW